MWDSAFSFAEASSGSSDSTFSLAEASSEVPTVLFIKNSEETMFLTADCANKTVERVRSERIGLGFARSD